MSAQASIGCFGPSQHRSSRAKSSCRPPQRRRLRAGSQQHVEDAALASRVSDQRIQNVFPGRNAASLASRYDTILGTHRPSWAWLAGFRRTGRTGRAHVSRSGCDDRSRRRTGSAIGAARSQGCVPSVPALASAAALPLVQADVLLLCCNACRTTALQQGSTSAITRERLPFCLVQQPAQFVKAPYVLGLAEHESVTVHGNRVVPAGEGPALLG